MKTNYLLLTLLALNIFTGCNNKKNEGSNYHAIRLPVYFEQSDFSLSEIASDIIFLPLSSDVPLPPSTQIECFDSVFYLRAQGGSKLYRFKFDGSFVDVLDKKGRGPEEYLAINNFHVDRSGNIFINCGTSNKIFVYNNDLTFNKTIPYPQGISNSYVYWSDSIIVFFPFKLGSPIEYDWIATSYKGEIIDSKMDHNHGRVFYAGGSFFAYEKDAVIYRYRDWSDTIFGITKNGYHAQYVFERSFEDGFKMASLDEIFVDLMSASQLKDYNPLAGKRNIGKIYDIGDKLIITYRGEKKESVLFDPDNSRSKIILENNSGLPRIPNDWLGSVPTNIRNILKIGNSRYIVDYIEAYNLKTLVQSDDFKAGKSTWPERKREFQLLGDNIDVNANLVLILIKLK